MKVSSFSSTRLLSHSLSLSDTRRFFQMLNKIPDVIKDIIFEYIHPLTLMTLNRSYYLQYHKIVKKHIPRNFYENYIRTILRKDCDFVFSLLLQENIKRWIAIKKYVYKSYCYANYVYFLKEFCLENESAKCSRVLYDFLNETGLSKNLHKKKIAINIKWR